MSFTQEEKEELLTGLNMLIQYKKDKFDYSKLIDKIKQKR